MDVDKININAMTQEERSELMRKGLLQAKKPCSACIMCNGQKVSCEVNGVKVSEMVKGTPEPEEHGIKLDEGTEVHTVKAKTVVHIKWAAGKVSRPVQKVQQQPQSGMALATTPSVSSNSALASDMDLETSYKLKTFRELEKGDSKPIASQSSVLQIADLSWHISKLEDTVNKVDPMAQDSASHLFTRHDTGETQCLSEKSWRHGRSTSMIIQHIQVFNGINSDFVMNLWDSSSPTQLISYFDSEGPAVVETTNVAPVRGQLEDSAKDHDGIQVILSELALVTAPAHLPMPALLLAPGGAVPPVCLMPPTPQNSQEQAAYSITPLINLSGLLHTPTVIPATESEITVGGLTLNPLTNSTSEHYSHARFCADSAADSCPPTAALATAALAPPAPPPALALAPTPSPAPAPTDGPTPALTPDMTTGPLTDIPAPLQTANLSPPQSSFSLLLPIAPETYGFAPPHFCPGFKMQSQF
ncbi:hypothetical protein CPB84DRAFT_1854212 [Gymnopilus junonius]|uniref:Uncharacterized protein n=1 Tax=Gymnopilus junonius TaxID=109634 RepID=A0A9P5N7Q6_GYMJU|nr:hypothetical protein CPB84DRAFT_1854212 [Gymnopilus junonius]